MSIRLAFYQARQDYKSVCLSRVIFLTSGLFKTTIPYVLGGQRPKHCPPTRPLPSVQTMIPFRELRTSVSLAPSWHARSTMLATMQVCGRDAPTPATANVRDQSPITLVRIRADPRSYNADVSTIGEVGTAGVSASLENGCDASPESSGAGPKQSLTIQELANRCTCSVLMRVLRMIAGGRTTTETSPRSCLSPEPCQIRERRSPAVDGLVPEHSIVHGAPFVLTEYLHQDIPC